MALLSAKTKIGKVIDHVVSVSDIFYSFSTSEEIFLNHTGETGTKHLFLSGQNYDTNKIPFFTTSIHHRIGAQDYIITDLRPFVSNSTNRGIRIRNKIEAELYIFRSALEDIIKTNGPDAIRDTFIETCPLYGWYIASTLGSSLNLPTYLLPTVSIVAQAFYLNSISDDSNFDENRGGYISRISSMNKFPVQSVSDVINGITLTPSIESMIDAIKTSIDSSRADSLSYSTMLAMTGSSYFGYNQTQVPMMAIESPSMWIPFASCVYRDSTKKRCKAAMILNNYSSKAEQFNIRKKLYQTLDTVLPSFEKDLLE